MRLGSPPQVRGKQPAPCRRVPHRGITPAGAGKTRLCGGLSARPEDHPRRCGENYVKNFMGYSTVGSPPQVRGKLNRNEPAAGLTRITPAGAGKTKTHQTAFLFARDHPRRCGENRSVKSRMMSARGSPPQVRGKHAAFMNELQSNGITPAGAGKTSATTQLPRIYRDHPRRCGENFRGFFRVSAERGSPPQVRGKRGIAVVGGGAEEDHPRRCGENPVPFGEQTEFPWITPAGAGKT